MLARKDHLLSDLEEVWYLYLMQSATCVRILFFKFPSPVTSIWGHLVTDIEEMKILYTSHLREPVYPPLNVERVLVEQKWQVRVLDSMTYVATAEVRFLRNRIKDVSRP